MNTSVADQWQNVLYRVSLILAPILLLATSVAEWAGAGPEKDGFGGTLKVITFLVFVYAILALTNMLWNRAPRTAVILRFIGLLGTVGAIGYGFLGIFYDVIVRAGGSATLLADFQNLANGLDGGFSGVPILQFPGFIWPLTMVAMGIALWRSRAVPAFAGILLAFAGLMFPIGRFPDIPSINYAADLLFVVSLGWIGLTQGATAERRERAVVAEAA
jgi:hypothetical protein